MKTRHKSKFAIAFVLTLTLSAIFASLPAAFGQTTLPGYTAMPDRDTGMRVAASPKLVGIGQQVLINIICWPGPADPHYYAQHVAASQLGFPGVECTIQKPDGTSETFKPQDITLENIGILEPGRMQTVGTLQFYYQPTQEGTYTITASFPGAHYTTDETAPALKMSVWYKASNSYAYPTTFTVQKDKVVESGLLTGWPWSPLPTVYWENPVFTNNREWYEISGDWVQNTYNIYATNYNEYSTAPRSPHILWRKVISGGSGLAGGHWGSLSYNVIPGAGDSPIILDGNIYINDGSGNIVCIDLRTGEELWTTPGSFWGAQRIYGAFQLPVQQNQGGITKVLWGGLQPQRFGLPGPGEWTQYNPANGAVVGRITNVPTDIMLTKYEDSDPVFWCVQSDYDFWNTTRPLQQAYMYLIKWDISKLTVRPFTTTGAFVVGSTGDWRDGVVWNVSVNDLPGQTVQLGDNNWISVNPFPYPDAGVVVMKPHNEQQILAGFDINTGALLWVNNATVIDPQVEDWGISTTPAGPIILQDITNGDMVAYNVKTGQEQWRADGGEAPWDIFPAFTYVYNDGVYFYGSFDGYVYAVDIQTGQQIWKSDFVGASDEWIYNNIPINAGSVGADGVLYFSSSTSYWLQPRTRYNTVWAMDESTGDIIWTLPIQPSENFGNSMSIADGYVVGKDPENGLLWCIGKGKTETTVSAPEVAVPKGTGAVIQGTVMDMSPGSAGTPAVAEEDMEMWMTYLHTQNAAMMNDPPTPTGVSVKLTVIKPDGSEEAITTVTTDEYGKFGYVYEPTMEGVYKVVAEFDGSESYWASSAEAVLGVGPAPSPAVPIEPEPAEPLITTEVAIIIAVVVIAVIGIAAYWVLRKRK